MFTLISVDSDCSIESAVPVMRIMNEPGVAVEFALTVI